MQTEKITFLGTGTCQLHENRRAPSYLIEKNTELFLFDIGHGIFDRLAELRIKNNSIENIIFSHYHPDHVSDLIPFLQSGAWSRTEPRIKDLNLWGPAGLKEVIAGFFSALTEEALVAGKYKLNLNEIEAGSYKIGSHELEFASLPPEGNHGIIFKINDKIVAITGDSYYHEAEANFLKDVDIAIIDSGHLTINEIAELAAKSQAKEIYCSHVYQEINISELTDLARSMGYQGKFYLAADLDKINF